MAATTPQTYTPASLSTPQVESLIALSLYSLSSGVAPGIVARRRGMSRTMGSNVARTLDRLVEMGLADYFTSGPQASPRYRITGAGLTLMEQVQPSEMGVFEGSAIRAVLGINIPTRGGA